MNKDLLTQSAGAHTLPGRHPKHPIRRPSLLAVKSESRRRRSVSNDELEPRSPRTERKLPNLSMRQASGLSASPDIEVPTPRKGNYFVIKSSSYPLPEVKKSPAGPTRCSSTPSSASTSSSEQQQQQQQPKPLMNSTDWLPAKDKETLQASVEELLQQRKEPGVSENEPKRLGRSAPAIFVGSSSNLLALSGATGASSATGGAASPSPVVSSPSLPLLPTTPQSASSSLSLSSDRVDGPVEPSTSMLLSVSGGSANSVSPSPTPGPADEPDAETEPEHEPETNIDRITQMAAKMFSARCLLSLIDEHRAWFKSIVCYADRTELDHDKAFCAPDLYKEDEVLEVPDTLQDPRFATSPLVVGRPFIRYYAGTPLRCADGFVLGTLCIVDDKPRTFSAEQLSCIQDIASLIIQELEQRLMAQLMEGISTASGVLMDASLDVTGAVEGVLQTVFTTLGLKSLELMLAEDGAHPSTVSFVLGSDELPIKRASEDQITIVAGSQSPVFFSRTDEVVSFGGDAASGSGPLMVRSTMVGLPLPVSDVELYGVAFLYNHIERPYTASDVDFLKSIVWSIASYLQRKKAEQASEDLLVNILPGPIVQQLKVNRKSVAHRIPNATILFADFVGFTTLASRLKPDEVVATLFRIFSIFDQLTERRNVEKVKTIGDAYMACAGVANPNKNHAECCVELALDMISMSKKLSARLGSETYQFRIGINSGPVVAGVLNLKRLAFDVFGDTVNTASRMESTSEPDCVRVSASTWALLDHDRYVCEQQVVQVKGKGVMPTYLIRGRTNVPRDDSFERALLKSTSPVMPLRALSGPLSSLRRSAADVDPASAQARVAAADSLRSSVDLDACFPVLRRSTDTRDTGSSKDALMRLSSSEGAPIVLRASDSSSDSLASMASMAPMASMASISLRGSGSQKIKSPSS